MFAALVKGPAPYVPRTNWPSWAVLPAGVVILILAGLIDSLLMIIHGIVSGSELPQTVNMREPQPQFMMQMAVWVVGLQVGLILLTVAAAGFFSSSRAETLALRAPATGWWVLPWALVPLFLVTALWTAIALALDRPAVLQDLRPFEVLLDSDARWPALAVICIGAPLSEELLFRGFLFSGLAKSRIGNIGAAVVTTVLWTSLHAGYSVYGLIEVLAIGFYLAWLLVRTGSLWVTIFCHGVYNTVITIILLLISLPA